MIPFPGRFWIAISIIFVLSSFSIQVASSKDNRAPLSPEYPSVITLFELLVVDPVVLPIPSDAPPGSGYTLEVGLYIPASGARLSILDSNGTPTIDFFSIASFQVTE